MLKESLKYITINDLLNDGKISLRASNCCLTANLNFLFDIIEYYKSGKSFRAIQNAGLLTQRELQSLCEEYILQIEHISDEKKFTQIQEEEWKNITITDLLNDGKMSIRARNCCLTAKLNFLFDIIGYYRSGQSFLDIQNAGEATQRELQSLCEEYVSPIERFINAKKYIADKKGENQEQFDISAAFSCLNDSQKAVLERQYDTFITTCSIPTMKRLREIRLEKFVTLLKSDDELRRFCKLQKKNFEQVLDLKHEMENIFVKQVNPQEENDSILDLIEQKDEIIQNDFVFAFYKQNHYLPMFWILEQTLKNGNIKKMKMLIEVLSIFQNQQRFTQKEIIEKYNITFYRSRLLLNKIFYSLFKKSNKIALKEKKNDKIKYLDLLQSKYAWKYAAEFIEKTHSVNKMPDNIQRCLTKEQCSFSIDFALRVIAYIFDNTFILYGGINANKKIKIWKTIFLIRKEYTDIFDFEKMKYEFDCALSKDEVNNYLNVKNYIVNSQCWRHRDLTKIDEITSIVKDILFYEFDLSSDNSKDGIIKIPIKQRNLCEVVYTILQQHGKPMRLNEIFKEFKRLFPEHRYTKPRLLRPYLYKNDAIGYIRRNGTHSLKEWEHIKTGTIRSAIVEFLTSEDLPQTAEKITKCMVDYFPGTNLASIRASMFSDSLNGFLYFEGDLFGLKNKQYPPEYKEGIHAKKEAIPFEGRLKHLETFIVENKRFPSLSAKNKEDGVLAKWLYRITNNQQQVTKKQLIEVNKMLNQYADYDTRRKNKKTIPKEKLEEKAKISHKRKK